MVWTRRFLGIVALIGAMAFVGTAFAKHQHHDGKQLLGKKIGNNGKHELHKVGDHTAQIQVTNKKISGVTVTHRTKGNVSVKKYKTTKKMVQANEFHFAMEDSSTLAQSASYKLAQGELVYIGYAFTDGTDE